MSSSAREFFFDPAPMYIIDLTHYLDPRGAIAPPSGPARRFADFVCAVVAHASDIERDDEAPGPICFKARKRTPHTVEALITSEGLVIWHCPDCDTGGQISNWQGTFWDLRQRHPSMPSRGIDDVHDIDAISRADEASPPASRAAAALRSPTPPAEDLRTFLSRQQPGDLVDVLVDLADAHEPVRERLQRMQLADRPDKLAAAFRKALADWRRSPRFLGRGEAAAFRHDADAWLDQVARELLPRDPAQALLLFEAFIDADADWFERADDSDGDIGETVSAACIHWLEAAKRCPPPPEGWGPRLQALHAADDHGARDALFRRADVLLDEAELRALVARLQQEMSDAVRLASEGDESLPYEVFRLSGALKLLSEALHDPDVYVCAVLKYSPQPDHVQRREFARDYLGMGRPADALRWLDGPGDAERIDLQDLRADALEQLGRFAESAPIRQRRFEQTLSVHDLECWLAHLSEDARVEASARAVQLAQAHANVVAAAQLLLHLGDASAAEARLLARPGSINGNDYGTLPPLGEALQRNACPRGATVIFRALLTAVLERAYATAYGHAADDWLRLADIAAGGSDLSPLVPHAEFEQMVRARHGRKRAFWARVAEAGGA